MSSSPTKKSSTTSGTKALSPTMPWNIVKNMRAVADVVCYDMYIRQDSMKQEDQFRFIYNAFHGNNDLNITSQVEMLTQNKHCFGIGIWLVIDKDRLNDPEPDVSIFRVCM